MKEVLRALPSVIRAYLSEEKYTPVVKELMATHGLRLDQGGVLEREVMLLLMGVESPEEFVQALIDEAKIQEDVVGEIVEDINTKIFVPLREEERKESVAGKSEVQTALVQAEVQPVENVPRAIHHELPQIARRVPVLPAKEVSVAAPASAPSNAVISLVAKPEQSIPRIIVPVPTKPVPPVEQKPTPSVPAAPPPAKPATLSAPVKSYSVDPYREPIE